MNRSLPLRKEIVLGKTSLDIASLFLARLFAWLRHRFVFSQKENLKSCFEIMQNFCFFFCLFTVRRKAEECCREGGLFTTSLRVQFLLKPTSQDSRSRQLLIRTGQCFLLNGFIFLGSLFVLNSVVIPMLQWILPDQGSQFNSQAAFDGVLGFYCFLRGLLIQLFYVSILVLSFVRLQPYSEQSLFIVHVPATEDLYLSFQIHEDLSLYNDIAKYGFAAMGRSGPSVVESSKQDGTSTSDKVHEARPVGLGGIMIGIGEQVYSVLLLSFFFLEVYATGFIPYVGKALNFLLLSWMYAYYCFEYKWNFSEWGLEKRLDFFETNWAFFAGFGNYFSPYLIASGSPCVLAIFFFSPLVSYGVMAILFPLFVLTATDTEAEQVISTQRRKWSGDELGRLPIFYAVDALLMRVLSLLPLESREQVQDNKKTL
ncbi:Etoposide-induced 2.4 [Corchorus olitorius]|uniref:Etoposide-induced 2.4 n=1 Tax=Corchorus olitorius TaxID=93759 RepID=A0A1R3JBL3_9ROSI|nr:Etoposide-induced 2.4 [Corchorus olitorius]